MCDALSTNAEKCADLSRKCCVSLRSVEAEGARPTSRGRDSKKELSVSEAILECCAGFPTGAPRSSSLLGLLAYRPLLGAWTVHHSWDHDEVRPTQNRTAGDGVCGGGGGGGGETRVVGHLHL